MENMTSYWDATTLAYVLEQEFDPAGQRFFNDFQHRALKELKEIEFNRKRKKNSYYCIGFHRAEFTPRMEIYF